LFVTGAHLAMSEARPASADEVAGEVPWMNLYKYFFLDAFYRGLLDDRGSRSRAIRSWLAHSTEDGFLELRRGRWLDSFCYSRDLWTRVACRDCCTVWTAVLRPSWMPRGRLASVEDAAPRHPESPPPV